MESPQDTTQSRKLEAQEDEKDNMTVDTSTFTSPPAVTNVRKEALITDRPQRQYATINSVYSKIWTSVDDLQIPATQFDEKSSFVPNSFKLFEMLSHMDKMIYGNDNLYFIKTDYLSMPIRIYYGILFLLQIVRVKIEAGTDETSESRWYRALTRTYKLESLPVAGPLIPFFESLAMHEPADKQYPLVYPTLPAKAIYSTAITSRRTDVTIDPTYHMLPAIPIMLDILKRFCLKTTIEAGDYDDRGNYVPFQLANGGSLGGINFEAQTGEEPLSAAKAQIFYNPGLAYGFPEELAKLSDQHHKWRQSIARRIPTPSTTEAYNPVTMAELTMMTKEKEWFEVMITAAATHATFFNHETNLSTISTTGSNSIGVQITLKIKEPENRPTTVQHWYTEYIFGMKAKAKSTTATLSIQEQWQALVSLTNANITWKDENDHEIGSKEAGHKTGPFWDNIKYNYQEDAWKPVMARTRILLLQHFYIARGIQNKIN